MMTMTVPATALRRHISLSTTAARRSFFASSTDHTTLLANAKVHSVPASGGGGDEYGLRQYILIPEDTPLEIALKVDKLHLARLSANRNLIFGAKVVQRSLGNQSLVCKPLLAKALNDVSSKGDIGVAMASLDGLCKWTSNALHELEGGNEQQKSDIESAEKVRKVLSKWKEDDDKVYEAIKAIATGIPRPGHSVVGQGTYRDGEEGWTQLAQIFVEDGLTEEGALYQSSGGTLKSIEHLADTTREGLMYSGGAMAKFEF